MPKIVRILIKDHVPRGPGWVAVLFMEDGTPLLVFGDFNIHLEKPYATDFHSLLASFDLKRLTTTSTHKSGNQLDLIYTRDCTADNSGTTTTYL